MLTAREKLARREAAVGDHLPYAAQIDDHTIVTRDGLALQVIRLEGLPFETIDALTLEARKNARDAMLLSVASSRFALVHHVVRRAVEPKFEGKFDDPFSQSLDRAWQDRLATRRLYVNDLYLTLVIRPLGGRAGIAEKMLGLFGAGAGARQQAGPDMRQLNQAREAILSALEPYQPKLLSAYDLPKGLASEPLEFLASLLNGVSLPQLLPTGDLGHAMARRQISFGADAIEFGPMNGEPSEYAAILSIKDYPANTDAGMLDDLYRLPFEMTVTQSFAMIDRGPALERMDLALRRMRSADDAAISLRSELVLAKDEVAAGRAAFGEHHLTVMIRANELSELEVAIGEAQATLSEAGFAAVRENLGLEAAFWAQFPGNLVILRDAR